MSCGSSVDEGKLQFCFSKPVCVSEKRMIKMTEFLNVLIADQFSQITVLLFTSPYVSLAC